MLTPKAKAGPAEPAPARTPPPPPPPRRRAEEEEARSPSSGESIGDPIHLVEGPGAKAPPEPLRSPAQAVPKKRKPDQEVASPATADVTAKAVRSAVLQPEPPTAAAAKEDLGSSSGSEVASSRVASRTQASSGPPGASLGLAAKTKAKPGSGDAPSRKTKVPRLREAASSSNQPPSQSARAGREAPSSGLEPSSGSSSDTDSDASSASTTVSCVMEPVPATTLKALVAFFSKPTVKQEEGMAAHVVCQRQANQRNPTHPRHYLPGELLMLEDPRTRERFEPPRRIVLLGKGSWRLTYYMGDFVLKLSDSSHGNESKMAASFATVCAAVTWEGPIRVAFYDSKSYTTENFFGLVQQRVVMLKEVLPPLDAAARAQYFNYLAAVLTWVEARGVALKDIGPSNLAVTLGSKRTPLRAQFCDLQDWAFGGVRKKGDSGLFRMLKLFSPEIHDEIHSEWTRMRNNYPKRFLTFASKAPDYAHLLKVQKCMSAKGTLSTYFNRG